MIMSPDRAAGVRVSLPDRRKNETQRDNKPLSRHIASGDRACHFWSDGRVMCQKPPVSG